jgi:DNA-binding CsgD family transcriptional regulator
LGIFPGSGFDFMPPTLEENLAALESCATINELRDTFQRVIENHGFASFGLMDVSHPWERNPLLISTHSQQWIETYRSENFIATDPCLDAGLRTNLPFNWGSIRLPRVLGKRKPGAVRTMEAVRDFGVVEGVTIPVHYNDRLGRRFTSICALFWKDKPTSFLRKFRLDRAQLHLVTIYATHMAAELHAKEQCLPRSSTAFERNRPFLQLTDREREVLTWAAQGKTSDETSVIIGRSRKTVEAHITTAMMKLGASTKTQAAIQAVALGLINV